MRLVLIDDRIDDYNNIIQALTPDTDVIVFNYYTDTINDIKLKFLSRYDSVGIIQYKIDSSTYKLIDSMNPSTIYDVQTNDPNLDTWAAYIDFLLWVAFENNVQTIDLLMCKLWNDPNWVYIVGKLQTIVGIQIRASIDITKTIGGFILESDNVNTVGLYFTPLIAQYKYNFVSITTEYLELPIITPSILYRNVSYVITYTAVDDIQRSTPNRTYRLYVGNRNYLLDTPVSTFTPITESSTYVFDNVSLSSIGRATFTIVDETDVSNRVMVALFDIGVLYENHLDISFVHVPVQSISTIPNKPNRYKLQVRGLTNAQDYLVFLKSTNDVGDSGYYSAGGARPFSVPSSPNIVSTIPLVSSILVNIQPSSFDGGNVITSYAYSLDNTTFTPLSITDVSNKSFIIPNLTNGNTYTVYLNANNARGNSVATISSPTIPFDVPDPPIFNTVDPSFGSIIVRFFEPIFDGGNTITYEYSINDSPYRELTINEVSNRSFIIRNLTNEYSYTTSFRTVNARGNSTPVITAPIVPDFTVPDSPTIGNIIAFESSIYVEFNSPSFHGGNTITSYAYSVDGGNVYTSLTHDEFANRAFTVNGLLIRNFYVFYIVAVNARGYSTPLVTTPITPFVIPDPPYIQSTISFPESIQVMFSPPAFDGGNAITKYAYSVDNIIYIPLTTTDVSDQSFTIPDLVNGNSYVIYLVAFNARGKSAPAVSSSVILFTIPERPVVNQVLPLDSSIQVSFSPPFYDGGNAISGYAYTINNTDEYTAISAVDISAQTFTVNGLINGNSYTLYFVAINARDKSVPVVISNIVPFSTPFPPTIHTIVSFNSAVQVEFNPPTFDGGNTITSYAYSINGGNTYTPISSTDISTQSFRVSNLTNGIPYVVYLEAVNARGNSTPAISLSIIPFTIPNPPQIHNVVPAIDSIQVGFTEPTTDGGNAITSYAYSLDGTYFISLTQEDIRYKQFSVNGLIPASQYTIYMIAMNARGNSISGISRSVVTLANVYRNTSITITYSVHGGDSPATIGNTYHLYNGNTYLSTFVSSVETNPYMYVFANTRISTIGYTTFSIRDVTVQQTSFVVVTFERFVQLDSSGTLSFVSATDFSNNRFRISGLKNGVPYTVFVKAKNIFGNSVNYSFTSTIPFTVPDLPTITSVVQLSESAQISFSDPSFNGGNTITAYSYSINGGNTYTPILSTDISNKSFIIPSLQNGNTYSVYLTAVNARGNSIPAVSTPVRPFREPNPPSTVFATGFNGFVRVDYTPPLFDGGNAITAYLYSYDYGTTYHMETSTAGAFYIYNLSNGRPYNIYLKAVNSRGASLPIISSTVIPNKSDNTIYHNVSGTIRFVVDHLSIAANTGTRYDLYTEGNELAISSFVPTTNTPEYIFNDVFVSKFGYTTFYIKYTPEPTSNTQSSPIAVVSFTEFVLYNNPYTQLTFQTAPTISLNTNTIDVGGLIDGQQYIVFVKSTNARGDSVYYSYASAIPYREPNAPTNVTVTPLNRSIQVDFLPPSFDGGNEITSYVYSYDYGEHTYTIDASARSFFIPNLSNGRPYNIYLKAINARGESLPYISSTVTPTTPKNAIYQNESSTVRYLVPNKPIQSSGIPNITYGLFLSGSNIPISQFTSIADPHEYVFGNVVISQIGYVTFAIKDLTTPHPNTLYPTTIYSFTEFVAYSNDSSLVFQKATLSLTVPNAIIISGLIDGQQYIVFVKSTNARGDSVYYSFISTVPYREPDAPVFTTLVPLVGGIQVRFEPPSFNGGNTITSYAYSIDGGNTYTHLSRTDILNTSFTVGGLTNGTSYVIYLTAQNSRGYSIPRLSVPVVPFTVPDTPVFRSFLPSTDSILVDYDDPTFHGGNTITSYAYSIDDENTYVPVNADDFKYKQFLVENLVSGTTYSIYLKAYNARGYSTPIISFPIVTLTKIYRNTPTTLTYTISPDTQPTQSIVIGKTYQLYANNVLLSTFTPTPDSNTNTYVFNNVVVSVIGNQSFSIQEVSSFENTRSLLFAPRSRSLSTIVATFNRFVYYEYESNIPLSFVRATDFSNNKFSVFGLQNGTSYIVFLKARNINGSSVHYSFTSAIPFTVPDPPLFDSIEPLVGRIQVGFSDPVFNGGNTITSYDYSVNGGNTYSKLTNTEFTNRSFVITGLSNGNAFSIYLRGYNARGNSIPGISGNVVSFTVPSPPIITRVIPLDRSIQVQFTDSFNGGNTITSYEYSYDFGATYFVATVTTEPTGNTLLVPNLINNIPYYIYVRAKNARGYSLPYKSSETIPRPSILLTDSSFQNIYQNVKTTIYYQVNEPNNTEKLAKSGNTYALNIGGNILSTFTPTNGNTYEYVFGNVVVPTFGPTIFTITDVNTTSNVLTFTKFVEYQYQQELTFVSVAVPENNSNTIRVEGLDDGQQYVVFLKSINEQGDSEVYSFISQTPFREPDPPTIQLVTPLDRSIHVSFTKPSFDGGNTITAYAYSYDYGATYFTATIINGNTFIVPGLINDSPYYIYLKAQNARGYSIPALSYIVTPKEPIRIADSSTNDIYQNVNTTIHYFSNQLTTPSTLAKMGNTYALYVKGNALSSFTPSNGNTYEYVFGNVVVPTFGSTLFTIKDINSSATILSFTKFVLFQYQSSLSFIPTATNTSNSRAFLSNTIRIPGLEDGQQYIIFIKSTNAQGDSQNYSFTTQTPFRLPDPPTIQLVTPLDRYVEVSFTEPAFDGGNTITSYEYSYDFGETFTVAPITNGNTFIIPNLLNDYPYYIYLKAKNARGYSTATMSSVVTPQPYVLLTDNSSNDIYQNVNTTIRYSVNTRRTTEKLAKLGNTYALYVGDVILSTFTPTSENTFEYVFNDVVVHTFGNTVFTITDLYSSAVVLSFTKFVIYQYEANLSFQPIDVPEDNTIRIRGLTDGQQYIVFIKSTNSKGDSLYYSFESKTPFREPDSPIIQSVALKDRSVEVSFTPPSFDGGNNITAYEYSYDFGANYFVATVTNGNTFIVSGLINEIPYYIYLKTQNARGYSNPYISSAVTPKRTLNVPDKIYQNRTTTLRYILNNNVSSYLDKTAKNGNTYTLSVGNVVLSTFTPNHNTLEYVFGNVTVPIFGNVAFSISDITTVMFPTTNVVTFYEIVLYEYESDLSFVSVSLPLDTANTIRVQNLVDGQQYDLFIKSLNKQGDSEYYSFTSGTPYRLPDPPVIQYLQPNDASIDVFFTPPFDGGSPITSYSYAYTTTVEYQENHNGSALSYTTFEMRDDGLYRIPNLANGVMYTVYVKSNNIRGNSVASSSKSITPFSVPFSPTIYRLKPTDSTITVYFTEPANGGNTITDYLYSVNSANEQDYISMDRQPATNATYLISGLTNYTQYTVRVKAVNARGNSVASLPAIVNTSLVPNPPTIYELIPQTSAIDISFSVPDDGGNPIIDYAYSVNGGEYVSMNRPATNDIYRITDLSNGVPYTVSIQAMNIAGNSVSSNIRTASPFSVPDAPSIVSITPNNKRCVVVYSPPAWDGGNTIIGYKYSLNSGPLVNVETLDVPFIIDTTPTSVYQLINGTEYSVRLFAVNARGDSVASIIAPFTPRTVPDTPTRVRITESYQSVTVSFITLFDGGNPIVGYTYSLDGVMSTELYTTPRFTINGLVNGRTYVLGLHAKNDAGFSEYYQPVIPYTNPTKPVVTSIVPYDSKVTLGFIGENGGRDIITSYSIDGDVFIQLGFDRLNTYVFDISGLQNGTTYSVRIQTINLAGYSPISEPYSITAYTNPKTPTIRRIVPGIQTLTIFFTPNPDDGGNTVTQYEYTYNSFTGILQHSSIYLFDPSFVISNLTYGISYNVRIRAINSAGPSGFSNELIGSPVEVPIAPTINDIVSADRTLTIYLTKGEPRGTNAEICKYNVYNSFGELLDEREFQTDPTRLDASFTLTDILGTPLVNGVKYYIDIQNRNSNGYSTLSNREYDIPARPPLPPIFLTYSGVNGVATITFERDPDTGGAELTDILVSFNGPLRSIDKQSIGLDITTLRFGGLNNKTDYTLQLYAVNPAGISVPAELNVITYPDQTTLKYIQRNSTLNPNGSSSNRIRYSTIVGISSGNTQFV